MSFDHLRAYSEIQDPPYFVETNAATVFAGAVAVNAVVFEDIVGILKTPRIMLVGMYVVSTQNLPWSIWLSSAHVSSLGVQFQGRYDFDVANGRQIAAAGVFYYDRPVTRVFPPMPYEMPPDVNFPLQASTLRLGLQVNGGGVAKIAGVGGEISIKLLYVPAGE